MLNINLKLSVSERTEDLIKIAAMQWFFKAVPGSWDMAYHNFKYASELTESWVVREHYEYHTYEMLRELVEDFISTMSKNAENALKYAEVKCA